MDERASRPDQGDGDPASPWAADPSPGAQTTPGRHAAEPDPAPLTGEPVESSADVPDARSDVPVAGSASALPDRRTARRARRKERRPAPWWEFPVLIAVAILVAIGVKTWLVQPFYIPSASMEKTLHGCPGCTGDRILVNKPVYHLHDPRPGDIIVFRLPKAWEDSASSQEVAQKADGNFFSDGLRWFGQLVGFVPPDEKDLVKRVIAVGGQTVKCCDAQGRVQISDSGPDGPWRSLDEPYVYTDSTAGVPAAFGPVTVPKGRLWVMGDHRNDSADSRVHCGTSGPAGANCDAQRATVSNDDVIGKAILIIWPVSRWRTLGTPETFTAMAGSSAPSVLGALAVLPLGWGLRRRRIVSSGPARVTGSAAGDPGEAPDQPASS